MFEMKQPFHSYMDAQVYGYGSWPLGVPTTVTKHTTIVTRTLSYRFTPHFHPYVAQLIQRLIKKSVRGLQEADTDYVKKADGSTELLPDGTPKPVLYAPIFSTASYDPTDLVAKPHPVKDLDFTSSGAYAVYNWELFYHAPLLIGLHLSKNGQFQDAQRWFHYIFDPTDDSDGPTPARFWKVRPFQSTDVKMIEEILVNLATGTDPELAKETIESISAWKASPFRPHAVARYRPSAYMFKAVMAYLDNLIAWGDALFRQDTREAINEAMQIYVLAANILGPRPQAVPRKGSVRPQTYANLRADLDKFGNALRDLETDIPFDLAPHPGDAAASDQMNAIRSMGRALYFAVPRNDKLLGYWDTVADRLFKIRNSLNIEGVFRQLALFDPPIDPALLAKAAASGLDISSVVNGLNQPLPLVRFQLLLSKAVEVCQEVKSLGANLLSAIEKKDNETLAILRARHETSSLSIAETVKYQQWQEAIKTREGLSASLDNAFQRYVYHERLLGRASSELTLPALEALDAAGLEKMKFKSSEPSVALRDVPINVVRPPADEGGGHPLIQEEVTDLAKLADAQTSRETAAVMDKIGGILAVIPTFGGNIEPFGCGMTISFGGSNLAALMSLLSSFHKSDADGATYESGKAAKIGSYARREQEWALQSNSAAGEMTQLFKQIRAAQIRESISEREWRNHQAQIKQAEEIERFLTDERTGKTSSEALYIWMRREVKGLYGRVFQLAFDTAKKAERALQHELGDPRLSFLEPGYSSGKEGLLAGERLDLDLKRMESAYHDLNRREYELTKHVSLSAFAPYALIQLRATGKCAVVIPEELFDLDTPGHYFRRLRSVSLSIPCVAGPYTSVSCKLTLRKSTIRTSALLSDGEYARDGAEDPRFSDHFGSLESVVTSSGREDGGRFSDTPDDRLSPFEGAGAISEWQLELPGELRQFDYDTISDVILHLRYTAREGGVPLANGATGNLTERIEGAEAAGTVRFFSVRHEFPTEWARFKNVAIGGAVQRAELALPLREQHYPYWSRGHRDEVKALELFARTAVASVRVDALADGTGAHDALDPNPLYANLRVGALANIAKPAPTGNFRVFLDDNSMSDLWMAVTWGKA